MKGICFAFGFLFISALNGQEIKYKDDTIKVQFSLQQTSLKFQDLPYIELDGFQQYRPFGISRLPLARSGNNGLPVHNLNLNCQKWGINSNIGGYQPYLMKKKDLRFYDASRPFTMLKYTNGAEAEQLFSVLHTQNLGEGLNIGLEYRRTVSQGFFQNQQTNHTQFNSTYNLKNRRQRFESRGYFYINDIESQENGGIKVIDQQEDNSILLDVNLDNAQNQSRSLGYATRNSYDLIKLDSFNTVLNISHELNWDKSYRIFKDIINASEPQYNSFFIDSTQTEDSSYVQLLSNELSLNIFNRSLNVGFRNEQYHYFQNVLIDRDLESNYFVFELIGEINGKHQVKSKYEKGVSGFHKDEMQWSTEISFLEFNGIQSILNVLLNREQPDFFIQNQYTNQHFFERSFETSDYVDLNLTLKYKKWNLLTDIGFSQFDKFIFYDSTITPVQLADAFNVIHVNVEHKFNFLKHLNFNNKIYIQSIEEEDFIPLPTLFSYHTLYYERLFFDNALNIQVGFDYSFIDSYGGYNYSPALTQFYVDRRNADIGGAGQLDFFLNLRIEKAARLFIKAENILNEEFSKESFRVQDYPIPGRVVKVGFSWRMLN